MTTSTEIIFVLIFPLLGAVLGSFLSVVVVRGPALWKFVEGVPETAGKPPGLIAPRSHCPSCKATLGPLQLIPLASYAIARGKCRNCSAPISPLYPTLEVLGMTAGLLSALLFPSLAMASVVFVACLFLIALGAFDARTGFLPDVMTLPLAMVGILAARAGLGPPLGEALIGMGLGWGVLAGLNALYQLVRGREGLGGGDAKLLGAGGVFIGPYALPAVILTASTLALVIVLVSRRRELSAEAEIRFGPYLAAGIAVALFARSPVIGLSF